MMTAWTRWATEPLEPLVTCGAGKMPAYFERAICPFHKESGRNCRSRYGQESSQELGDRHFLLSGHHEFLPFGR
ncbi:MAG: hypothetical protein HC879_13880 [Leptolyngbyaceae cyanobacterium SL_5_9]|nr:hypothetical protein [Leptolyngbyaceae cyanobacterium SL_5_9]